MYCSDCKNKLSKEYVNIYYNADCTKGHFMYNDFDWHKRKIKEICMECSEENILKYTGIEGLRVWNICKNYSKNIGVLTGIWENDFCTQCNEHLWSNNWDRKENVPFYPDSRNCGVCIADSTPKELADKISKLYKRIEQLDTELYLADEDNYNNDASFYGIDNMDKKPDRSIEEINKALRTVNLLLKPLNEKREPYVKMNEKFREEFRNELKG